MLMWREFEGIYIERPTEITIGSNLYPDSLRRCGKALKTAKTLQAHLVQGGRTFEI